MQGFSFNRFCVSDFGLGDLEARNGKFRQENPTTATTSSVGSLCWNLREVPLIVINHRTIETKIQKQPSCEKAIFLSTFAKWSQRIVWAKALRKCKGFRTSAHMHCLSCVVGGGMMPSLHGTTLWVVNVAKAHTKTYCRQGPSLDALAQVKF